MTLIITVPKCKGLKVQSRIDVLIIIIIITLFIYPLTILKQKYLERISKYLSI